jgi:hypothetical protein
MSSGFLSTSDNFTNGSDNVRDRPIFYGLISHENSEDLTLIIVFSAVVVSLIFTLDVTCTITPPLPSFTT